MTQTLRLTRRDLSRLEIGLALDAEIEECLDSPDSRRRLRLIRYLADRLDSAARRMTTHQRISLSNVTADPAHWAVLESAARAFLHAVPNALGWATMQDIDREINRGEKLLSAIARARGES